MTRWNPPRVQQAVRATGTTDASRRAELLEEIRKAQERREEARRVYADSEKDKENWLDIKRLTGNRVSKACKEYNKLTGSAFGDIPPLTWRETHPQ